MGILGALASAFFAGAKDLVSKSVAENVAGITSAFASFLFCLPFYILLLGAQWILSGDPFFFGSGFWSYVLLRALSDTIAEWCKMECLRHGDISLLSGFISLSPLFLLVLSPLITGDQVTTIGAVGVCIVVASGLAVIWKPGQRYGGLPIKGVLFALASAFFFALNNCFDRLAVQQAAPVVSGFVMSVLAGLFLLLPALRHHSRLTNLRRYWRPFTLRGAFETAQMITKLYALQFIQAPYVASFMRLSLLVSILGGRVLFGEPETGRRFVAGVLLVVGTAIIAFLVT